MSLEMEGCFTITWWLWLLQLVGEQRMAFARVNMDKVQSQIHTMARE